MIGPSRRPLFGFNVRPLRVGRGAGQSGTERGLLPTDFGLGMFVSFTNAAYSFFRLPPTICIFDLTNGASLNETFVRLRHIVLDVLILFPFLCISS